jgi:hypothetical protein
MVGRRVPITRSTRATAIIQTQPLSFPVAKRTKAARSQARRTTKGYERRHPPAVTGAQATPGQQQRRGAAAAQGHRQGKGTGPARGHQRRRGGNAAQGQQQRKGGAATQGQQQRKGGNAAQGQQQRRGGDVAQGCRQQLRGGGAAQGKQSRAAGGDQENKEEGEDQDLQDESGGELEEKEHAQRKERGHRSEVEVRAEVSVRIKNERSWRKEDMVKAVLQVIAGKQQRKAAKDNNVPYSTLRRRVKGEGKKKGAPTVLPRHVEQQIVDWIKEMSDKALSPNKQEVGLRVKEILEITKHENPFTDGIPGRRWWELFAVVAKNNGKERADLEQGPSHGS